MAELDGGRPRDGDSPLAWGVNEEMNAAEAVMWRVEVDRTLRSTGLVVEELDTVPDWDRFLAAHEWGVRMAPRFRQRVVEAPFGLGAPRWTVDPDFDLRFHVRRARLPRGGGWPELVLGEAAVRQSQRLGVIGMDDQGVRGTTDLHGLIWDALQRLLADGGQARQRAWHGIVNVIRHTGDHKTHPRQGQ